MDGRTGGGGASDAVSRHAFFGQFMNGLENGAALRLCTSGT
jgi:hypothetical protein